jgi:hypothetical protein
MQGTGYVLSEIRPPRLMRGSRTRHTPSLLKVCWIVRNLIGVGRIERCLMDV